MQVIFSQRAFVSVLAETAEKIQTETGGIFLGYRDGESWYIVEAIDPGPKSTFQVAYFEYDTKYVNHLSLKIARLYNKPLELLGLWHRHPGSFDQFSGTDDGTNAQYASLNANGALSALVNLDPEFRLTVFHVTAPLSYRRVPYRVGDDLIPEQFRKLCDTQRLLDYTSAKTSSIWGTGKPRKPKYKYDVMLNEIIKNLALIEITNNINEETLPDLTDEDIALILEQTEKDLEYFGECYMDFKVSLQEKVLQAQNQDNPRQILQFARVPGDTVCMFKFAERFYYYKSGLFKGIIEDAIETMKKIPKIFGFTRHFVIDKEFVECCLKKIKNN